MLGSAAPVASRTTLYPAPVPQPRPSSANPPPELPSLRDCPSFAPLSSSLHQPSSIATSVSTFLPASSLFLHPASSCTRPLPASSLFPRPASSCTRPLPTHCYRLLSALCSASAQAFPSLTKI